MASKVTPSMTPSITPLTTTTMITLYLQVVPLYISLHLVASVLGLYDGREGRALDFQRR